MLLSAERGDAFTPENIRNLSLVGYFIIASSLLRFVTASMLVHRMAVYVAEHVTQHIAPGQMVLDLTVDGNVSGVVTGLMILVLAKVFRHGVALEEESALTI